jgi:hypothetical protein
MPWYSLPESGLIVRGNKPPESVEALRLMLANTLEQAAKLEDDPEAAARMAGEIMYEKAMLSSPPSSLKELLDLADLDDALWDWLTIAGVPLPTEPTPRSGEPAPTLVDLAQMA